MRERRGHLASEQAGEPDLDRRRGQQVAAADDQVDALTLVIDDDREPVGPVPGAVADREVAVGPDLVGARPDDRIHPALGPPAERRTKDRAFETARPAAPRAARPVPAPAVLVRPGLERRPRAVAAIDDDRLAEPAERRAVRLIVVRLADGPGVGDEPEPGKVLEQGRLEPHTRPGPSRGPRCAGGPGVRSWRPCPRPR